MNSLSHHGILGQKWGVRRYQNPDGTLTEEGKRHQAQLQKDFESGKVSKDQIVKELNESGMQNYNSAINKAINDVNNSDYKKRYEQAFARSAALDNEAMGMNAMMGFGAIPMGRGSAELALRKRELEEYSNRYIQENIDTFASAMIADLGYDDTKAGREYLKKLGLL